MKTKDRFIGILCHWMPLGFAIVGVCGLSYAMVQQDLRQSANDPQIQIVEDGARALAAGKLPVDIVPQTDPIDVSVSLSPFVIVYDKDGNPLQSSGKIGDRVPKFPAGVFAYAKLHGEDRVTWQPDRGTRIALVVRAVDGDSGMFIASGRNMREVENREDNSLHLVFLTMLIILLGTFLLDVLGDAIRRRMMARGK
jgi:hypothetical protein